MSHILKATEPKLFANYHEDWSKQSISNATSPNYANYEVIHALKGLSHDSAHMWAATVAHCLWTNRKRVRCTRGNLHDLRFIIREAGVFRTFLFDFIYPHNSCLFSGIPQINVAADIYLPVFLRAHARKPVSDPQTKIISKQTLLISGCLPYTNLEIPANSSWPVIKTHSIEWGKRFA